MKSNIQLSIEILKQIAHLGVTDICLCAGARNASFVKVLENSTGFNVLSFFEERSASFFALGRAVASNRPVAVITTSGTAASELLSASIESYYSGVPLIFITADRPKTYRGTGSPQSIEQIGLYSQYVKSQFDVDVNFESINKIGLNWDMKQTLHINVCFDEPLIDQKIEHSVFIVNKEPKSSDRKGLAFNDDSVGELRSLVIVSGLSSSNREFVTQQLVKLQFPIYAESNSGIKGDVRLNHLVLKSGDKIVDWIFQNKFCNSVIRIGGIPTLRFWRDLEGKYKDVSVYNFSDLEFSGLSRSSKSYPITELEQLSINLKNRFEEDNTIQHKSIFEFDRLMTQKLQTLVETYPQSEAALICKLSNTLDGEKIYLGNSLPIREWDLVGKMFPHQDAFANRGANGIDGQVSTFIGWADLENPSWAILGDLTALYDLVGLWGVRIAQTNKLRLVVINNGGGQIFNRIFGSGLFINQHDLNFKNWALMWGINYYHWNEIETVKATEPNCIIEIQPNADHTKLFWDEWDKSWKH